MLNKIYSRSEKSKDIFHKDNQDYCFYGTYFLLNDDKISVFAVADGMGGLEDGEIASRNAIEGFFESFHRGLLSRYMGLSNAFSISHYLDSVKAAAIEAVKDANRKVCKNADEFKEIGTTLSAMILINDCALCINVGDSPVYYYFSQSDEFHMISTLQTKAEAEYLRGACERYSAEYYEKEHIVTASLGNFAELREEDIKIKVLEKIVPGDRFILGSDGCFGRMMEDEIWSIINQENGHQALKQLFKRAREDKNDDQTAILYCLNQEV